MASPNSAVDICNLALSHLDAGTVADISTSPQTDAELICQRWYDTTRRGLLRQNVWNFAKKRGTVSRTGTPAFGFADAYTFPGDYIRMLSFGSSDDLGGYYDWYKYRHLYEIEGRKLLINNEGDASINLIYIYDNTNVTDFDSLFIETLALKLAYKMAYDFTTKRLVVVGIKEALDDKIQQAAAIDAQERPPKRLEHSRLKAARRRNGTSTVASPYTIFER